MFYSCHVVDECESIDLWLVYSACSDHMFGNKSLFSSSDVSFKTIVKFWDNQLIDVQGKGIVFIVSKQNEVNDILDVYHVNVIKHNLFSVG